MRTITAGIVLCVIVGRAGANDQLDALNNRVVELYQQGDHADAIKLAEQAVKVAERQFGKDALETAKPISNLAFFCYSQGNPLKAEPLLQQALSIRENLLGPNHPDTAATLHSLGMLNESQGKPNAAEVLYQRALSIREKALGPDHSLTATSLSSLASLYESQGKYTEAEPLKNRTLAICEKVLGPDHPLTATSLNNLACLYSSQGKYAEAEPLHKRALAISEKALGPDHLSTATSLNNLAGIYYALGRYAEAEPLFTRALVIRGKSLGSEHPDTAETLNNLALLYECQGKYAEAEPLLKRSLAISEKALGTDHSSVATSLNNLAGLYKAQGRHAEAEPLYKRALAIHEKSLGPNHPDTATSLNNLAALYEARANYADSEPLYKRALASYEKALGPNHPNMAQSLNNLAFLYDLQGKHAEAEPLYTRSVLIREKALGPDHPDTAQSLNNLAVHQAARGRVPDAAGLTDRARRGTRRHVARVLPSLSAPEQAEFLRSRDIASLSGALSLGVRERLRPEIAALSAGWLANGKAVGQEAASQQIILARQSENPATQAAVAALTRVRADLAKLAQMTPSPDDAASYRAKLAELQAEEHRLVHEIGGQLAALDRDEPWVEIDEIRRKIPAGSVLVDIARFGVFDFAAKSAKQKWQPARYAAWVIPPAGQGDVTIVDLGPAEAIDAAVAAYRKAIDAVQKGGFKRGQDAAEQELKITAAPLTQKVFQPIVDAIGSAADIILSPDGALWLLPWQAIPLADGTYAIEKYSIRTVTSGRDLVPVAVEAKGSQRGPVVVADPAFDSALTGSSGKPTSDASRSFVPASGIDRRFARLPNTRAEAMASKPVLAKLSGSEPKILLGPEASEVNLKQAAVRPKAVVLATHGFFKPDQEVNRDDRAGGSFAGTGSGSRGATRAVTTTGEALEDPLLRCGLALAGANVGAKADGGDDGILTGAEIAGLDLLGTDLVVLSACETGVGKVQVGEGVAGLRQAFQIAGAKSVVATLWQVPDAESAQIMAAFYANVAKGEPPSKALREAQLGFIKARREDRNYEAAHPYLWAAYGVTGR